MIVSNSSDSAGCEKEAKNPVEFFFNARTQHQNLGDLVINREMLAVAAKCGPIHLYTGGMPETFIEGMKADRYDVSRSLGAFSSKLLRSAIRRIISKSSPRVYFLLNPGGFSGGLSPRSVPRQIAVLAQYALLSVLGVRLIRLGASFGPFSPGRMLLEKLKHRLIFHNTGRDQLSVMYARRFGLMSFTHFPDFAFMLPAPDTEVDTSRQAEAPFVVASFRSEPGKGSYDEAVENALLAMITKLVSRQGGKVVFATQVSFDHARNAALRAKLEQAGFSVESSEARSERDLLGLYRQASHVLSNRLHVLLFALRQGTPAYAVVDQKLNSKIIGIYTDLGLSDLIVDVGVPAFDVATMPVDETRLKNIFAKQQVEIHTEFLRLINEES